MVFPYHLLGWRTFGHAAPHPSLVDSSPVILLGSVAKAFVLESEGLYGMPSEHAAFVTYLFAHPGSPSGDDVAGSACKPVLSGQIQADKNKSRMIELTIVFVCLRILQQSPNTSKGFAHIIHFISSTCCRPPAPGSCP